MFEHCNCFIVKATRDCNLRCKYCYIADKDNYKGEVMPFAIFKKLVDRICFEKNYRKFQESNREREKDFSFIFHGGEPTIVGPEILSKYLSYAANSFRLAKLKVSFGIQTNATLITEELCALFHDYNVHVGMSIDGSAESNKLRGSHNYSTILQLLKDYNVPYGCLSVVSQQNINRIQESLEFFKKTLKVYSGKFNFAEDLWNFGDVEVPGEEYLNKCVIPLYEEAEKKILALEKIGSTDSTEIYIDSHVTQHLDSYFNRLLGSKEEENLYSLNSAGNCHVKFCGAGKEVVEISPDGTINFCGRYSADTEKSRCSTLDTPDFLATMTRKNMYKHIYEKHNLLLSQHCDICIARDVCDGGCYAFTYEKFGELRPQKELLCNFYIPYKKWLIKSEGRLWNIQFGLKQRNFIVYQQAKLPRDKAVESFLAEKEHYLNKIQSRFSYEVKLDDNFTSDNPRIIQLKIINKTLQDRFKK